MTLSMRAFIRIHRAIDSTAQHYMDCCDVCGQADSGHRERPIYEERPESATIARFVPTLPICDECYTDCNEVCRAAQALIASHNAGRPKPHPARPVPIVGRRIALLRALSKTMLFDTPLSRGDPGSPCRPFTSPSRCTWCNGPPPYSGNPVCVGQRKRSGGAVFWFHQSCWDTIGQVVHEEHLAQCMATCAMMLPVYPEIRRVIGAFVCRLAAVGVEAASAGRCPVY